jgi:PAS domain S-box-containing protein
MKPTKQVLRNLFLAAMGLLAASFLFTYLIGVYVMDANRTMTSQRAVIRHVDALLSTMKDAETGQRGYVITGKPEYLQPYQDALKHISDEEDALQDFVAAGKLPKAAVENLDQLVKEKLAELALTIKLRGTNADESLTEIQTGRGKAIMGGIRAIVATMDTEQESKYLQAVHQANQAIVLGTGAFLFIALVDFAFLAWAFRNIAEQMALREAAVLETNRQKELLGTTLASIGDGVIMTDAQGNVTFLNMEAERLTGWNTSESQGKPLPAIFPIINEDTRQTVENPVEKVLRLGKVVGLANHTLLLSKDGREIPIDDSAAPIRDANGPIQGVVLVFRDFTDYKKVERELHEAQNQLQAHAHVLEKTVEERTKKLTEMISELEHVSHAITHDMRAPLRAMNGFATLLMEESANGLNPEEARAYCRRIVTGATRLDELITDSLSYTKAVLLEVPMHPVDLNTLIRGLLETYPNLHPDNTDIRIEGELPTVLGNESLLTQCFSNLLGNAVKFVEKDVRPQIRIRATTIDGSTRISVQDNGIGIPANAQYRLFGMFQKLDSNYEGTGIGLAIVRKVVERMGGKVSVDSEPGRGSTFQVELRCA